MRRDLSGVLLTASSAQDPPYVDLDNVDPLNIPPGYQASLSYRESQKEVGRDIELALFTI